MARSKRDDMKRDIAQSVNHLAVAILNVNDVYEQFNGVHQEDADQLARMMMTISSARDALLEFAVRTWALGEEGLMRQL